MLPQVRSEGLYVLMALTDAVNAILIVEQVRLQYLVKSISGALDAPPGQLLQLH